MNKEQLEKLSDFDINSLIISKLEIESDVHFGGGAITRHVNNGEVLRCTETLDYCNNAADMMPLVFECGISLVSCYDKTYSACSEIHHSIDDHDEYENEVYHSNPLRAAAIVWLLMQGDM